MPSTLVSELLEYISRSFYQLKPDSEQENNHFPNNLIQQHHLQPFNKAYYLTDNLSNDQSYNPTWMITDYQLAKDAKPLAITPAKEIELELFISTLCQPQKRFYQSSLALKLPQGDEINKDEEPFSLII